MAFSILTIIFIWQPVRKAVITALAIFSPSGDVMRSLSRYSLKKAQFFYPCFAAYRTNIAVYAACTIRACAFLLNYGQLHA